MAEGAVNSECKKTHPVFLKWTLGHILDFTNLLVSMSWWWGLGRALGVK